jgi:hypothetical protein
MPTIREGIYELLRSVTITTKELGKVHIEPWLSQRIIIDSVCKGLSEGVHEFAILKCRQVAATTTCSIIELFWALTNPGTQAAIIADRSDNLERLRRIFADFVTSLPREWRGPEHAIIKNNRNGLEFANKSVIDLLAAGSNPDLGASRAISCGHFTECSLWRSLAGVESLRASLARENPNRLYFFESVANGFNWWYNYIQECKEDTRHKRFIFLGFWSQPMYSIPKSDPDFATYMPSKNGAYSLTDDEIKLSQYVAQHYNYRIKFEQIAWYRRESEFRPPEQMWRHYPWTEQQAFVASGHSFFPAQRMLDVTAGLEARPLYKGYRYKFDEEFLKSTIEQVSDPNDAELRIWEPPDDLGVYAIGVDPSGGGGGDANDHAIQVLRVYADRAIQVAEYQSNKPLTYQCAWVLCHLVGAYQNHQANLEISGIGAAVQVEVDHLRRMAEAGMLTSLPGEDPILEMIGTVRWYLYSRPDTLSGFGSVQNWKMNNDNKAQIFSELRDGMMLRQLEIRSVRLAQQMRAIVEDDGWIGAGEDTGEGDDLVIALVLAYHAYAQRQRNMLIAQDWTWARMHEKPPQDEDLGKQLSRISTQMTRAIWQRADERRAEARRGR